MRRSKRKVPAAAATTTTATTSDEAACPCVKRLSQMAWRSWQSSHPERQRRERQATSWIEFTRRTIADDDATTLPSLTGLTQGILRLEPHKQLPVHHHPAPFSETYYFLRGNGVVRLGREPLGAAFLSERPRLTADEAQELEERSCRRRAAQHLGCQPRVALEHPVQDPLADAGGVQGRQLVIRLREGRVAPHESLGAVCVDELDKHSAPAPHAIS